MFISKTKKDFEFNESIPSGSVYVNKSGCNKKGLLRIVFINYFHQQVVWCIGNKKLKQKL